MTAIDRVPDYQTLVLERRERRLTITINRPEKLNAVNPRLHAELAEVFVFAAADTASDVVVLTGEGRAFSAGGDLEHIHHLAQHPDAFDEDIRLAKQIVFSLLALEKPVICRMNGHAVGLGATLALFCDIVVAVETARIGDPHVAVGLVAGDGGAVIWPQLIGLCRSKEYLLTGELLGAVRAAEIGLINYAVPVSELDAKVDALCEALLDHPSDAVRKTKVLLNHELKRVANELLEQGLQYEAQTIASSAHREIVSALVRDSKDS